MAETILNAGQYRFDPKTFTLSDKNETIKAGVAYKNGRPDRVVLVTRLNGMERTYEITRGDDCTWEKALASGLITFKREKEFLVWGIFDTGSSPQRLSSIEAEAIVIVNNWIEAIPHEGDEKAICNNLNALLTILKQVSYNSANDH